MMLCSLSLMFPPLEKCDGNVQAVRQTCHCCAVGKREQRVELISSPPAIAVSLSLCYTHTHTHRAKARHPALCLPAGGPTHLRTDITHQECYEYTRFLRDRRVTFRDFVKCIRFISNKRRSLAVHGELWAHLTCCCSSF